MLKNLSFCFLLVIFNQVSAQDSAAVHFEFPNNGKFEIRIDSNLIFRSNKFHLIEGHHYVEIWVPGLELQKDSIIVNPDSYNLFQFTKAAVVAEIEENKKERVNYTIKKSLAYSSTVPSTLLTYFTVQKYKRATSIYGQIESLRYRYSQSLNLNFLADSELKYANLISSYERTRNEYRGLIVLSSVALACNITLIYLFHRNFKRPKKFKINSPFVKQPMNLSFTPTINGLTLKLQI